MFQVSHFVSDINEVPSQWMFERYLNLSQPLIGQRVMIKSVFNATDKNPSLSIYHNTHLDQYRFKDFSTGTGGSAFDLLRHLWNTSPATTYARIFSDYKTYLDNGGKACYDIPAHVSWKVSGYKPRAWNKNDVSFWSPYNIGSDLLKRFNVVALSSFTLERMVYGELEKHEILDPVMYGYFTASGVLYKIYRPHKKKYKFYKVSNTNYIQGTDQLRDCRFLIITSSLKDAMTLSSMNLNTDVIAPDSENTMLKEEFINKMKERYTKVVTSFDSDMAGVTNMARYRDQYGLPIVYYTGAKDISDAMKAFGMKKLFSDYVPLLNRALNKTENSSMLVCD